MTNTIESGMETNVDSKALTAATNLVEKIETLLESPRVKDLRDAIEVLKKAENGYENELAVIKALRSRRSEFEDELTKKLEEIISK